MRFLIGTFVAVHALVPTLAAQGTVPGWYEEARVVTTQTNASRQPSASLTRSWHAGVRRRTETETMQPGRPTRSYSLVLDTTGTSYLVSPATKTIRIMTSAGLARESVIDFPATARALNHYEDLGPGEPILGHATRRFRTSSSFAMKMGAIGDSTPRTVRYTLTVWLTSDSTDPAIRAAIQSTRRPARSNLPRGFALRRDVVTDGLMPGVTSATSIVVEALRVANVDTALFTLPRDYRRTNVTDEMRALQQNMAAMQQRTRALEAALAELKRLNAGASPRDKARARALSDSLFRAMRPDSARLRTLMLNDPNAIRITDSTKRRKP